MLDATAGALAKSMAALMRGQLYPGSESDSPYRPFAALLPSGRLDANSFRTAAHVPRGWQAELEDANQWLGEQATTPADPSDESARAEAEAYRVLTDLLRATMGPRLHLGAAIPPLDWMSTFHRTRRYIVGRFDRTHMVGLVASSVET
jgi:hypothetical protein